MLGVMRVTPMRVAALILSILFSTAAIVSAVFLAVQSAPQPGVQSVLVGAAVASWVWLISQIHRDDIKTANDDIHGSILTAITKICDDHDDDEITIVRQRNGGEVMRALLRPVQD